MSIRKSVTRFKNVMSGLNAYVITKASLFLIWLWDCIVPVRKGVGNTNCELAWQQTYRDNHSRGACSKVHIKIGIFYQSKCAPHPLCECSPFSAMRLPLCVGDSWHTIKLPRENITTQSSRRMNIYYNVGHSAPSNCDSVQEHSSRTPQLITTRRCMCFCVCCTSNISYI